MVITEKPDLFNLFDNSNLVYGVDPGKGTDNFAMMIFKTSNIFNCTISENGMVMGTAWCSIEQIEEMRIKGLQVIIFEEAKNPLLEWKFDGAGICNIDYQREFTADFVKTKEECLFCGLELDEPYIDPESDGSIHYNWKKYCSTYCENCNEYE